MSKADIGLIGLAVMGQNLVLNMADHGYRVAVYNRTPATMDAFLVDQAVDKSIQGYRSIQTLCSALAKPRKIMLMVQAGSVVDQLIEQLLPFLESGDIIIDGGNSLYTDTQRRVEYCAEHNLHYLGIGVSGGEEGARFGPSLMPGGDKKAWPAVQDIFQSIAAKVDGEPCCQWVGEGGAGHYVKMIHNGIEYGDMQLIGEAYQILRDGAGLSVDEIADVFAQWNKGVLDSYLVEITADILRVKDADGEPLLDKIRDTAGQKGTGKWTAINALELGMPLTLISEAVFARFLSSLKDERMQAAAVLSGPVAQIEAERQAMIEAVHDALYASKIMSYTQGFMLMRQAATHYRWQLAYGDIALMWRGGCIIRSRFLHNIKQAYTESPDLNNLLFHDFFNQAVDKAQSGWRQTLVWAITAGLPAPAFSSALAFFDSYRSACLPANLLQAQRDYFGAHTFERIDSPKGQFFHYDWLSNQAKETRP